MKELDCIEVIVEKKKYTEDGVHKPVGSAMINVWMAIGWSTFHSMVTNRISQPLVCMS